MSKRKGKVVQWEGEEPELAVWQRLTTHFFWLRHSKPSLSLPSVKITTPSLAFQQPQYMKPKATSQRLQDAVSAKTLLKQQKIFTTLRRLVFNLIKLQTTEPTPTFQKLDTIVHSLKGFTGIFSPGRVFCVVIADYIIMCVYVCVAGFWFICTIEMCIIHILLLNIQTWNQKLNF